MFTERIIVLYIMILDTYDEMKEVIKSIYYKDILNVVYYLKRI